jgi:hypothetical protein
VDAGQAQVNTTKAHNHSFPCKHPSPQAHLHLAIPRQAAVARANSQAAQAKAAAQVGAVVVKASKVQEVQDSLTLVDKPLNNLNNNSISNNHINLKRPQPILRPSESNCTS